MIESTDVQDVVEHLRGTSSQRTNNKKNVLLGPKHLLFLEVKVVHLAGSQFLRLKRLSRARL